jgi:hypothetical protein
MKRQVEKACTAFWKANILFGVVICVMLFASAAPVQAGIVDDDPMIKITSMPLGLDVNKVLAKVSADVAHDTGFKEDMVTYYWQTFDAIYCPGCKGAPKSLVIFVDMYVAGFMTDREIAGFMTSIAASLEKHTGVPKEWVFIHTHLPKEGHIYINGKVATWGDIKALDPRVPSPKK